ncbi:bifunctional metallophosphatase/5'-nucleotidase [Lactobacillus sp. S2-2]|uniref:bifunctional metallophosphatase/5'-nucleotidase n=1 Tax=Lactobacillus sp. S2-2 TaxID=2692917 RepID=UPI001F37B2D5|nr:bifunctional metallophosphatase/5'-nucleotidase [Lactobacillus sp. S2-2]MCF6515836.1 bifunctional metallophosphatase/5'-nucleotidase [Lactobacillus sp. S2-2]
MKQKLLILHTNDLHSHFEHWPQIKAYIKEETDKYQNKGYQVLKFDDGDAMDRFHPLTEATDGKYNTKLLNEVGYDAVTIGNNEALTNSHQQLLDLYSNKNFDVLLSNILDESTGKIPEFGIEKKDIYLNDGTKVRIFGLTFPYATYEYMNWIPLNIFDTIHKLLDKWQNNFDYLILLSHLGISNDEKIADEFPEINLIIGSHTHHLLKEGKLVNYSLLTAAGKYGNYIGEIKIEFNYNKPIKQKAMVESVNDLKRLENKKEVYNLEKLGNEKLDEIEVAKLDHNLSYDELIKIGLEGIEEKAGASVGVLNYGLFLHQLKKGIITKKDIHSMLPHSMHVMVSTFKGSDLIRLFKEMEKNKMFLKKFEQKGMGFRGLYFGLLKYDKLEYKDNKLFYNNELVKLDEFYTIALLDHYLFIPFFPSIEISGKNRIIYNQSLRDVFADKLSKIYPIR